MSDPTYAHIDNQFVSIKPVYTLPKRPIIRQDYTATLVNLKKPEQPLEVSPVEPRQLKSPAVEVKPHRSHQPVLSHEFFSRVLVASGILNTNSKAHKRRIRLPRFTALQYSALSLAACLLIIGGFFSYSGMRSIHAAKIQAFNLTKIANQVSKSTASADPSKNPALSTVPISANTLADYEVAPNLPRYLMIPKLSVDARVLSVGVTSTGALGTPDNVFDTAWYNESAEPGQPGAMLIDGHVSSWTSHGVFYGLKNLVAGDEVQVERGDGTMFTYQVVKTQIFTSNSVDMQSAMTPVVAGQPGLNLITCTGDVIPGTSLFNERIIVYTTQVSS